MRPMLSSLPSTPQMHRLMRHFAVARSGLGPRRHGALQHAVVLVAWQHPSSPGVAVVVVGSGMCPLQFASNEWSCGAAVYANVCRSCCDRGRIASCRVGSRASFSSFPLRSKHVARSSWLVRLANGQTYGPASSISPAQSRPRALRRSTASDSADTPVQYHNLERWPAAALSLNYQEGAAMLPSGAATSGVRSQARARDRLSITGLDCRL
jgi:hypothetical protein